MTGEYVSAFGEAFSEGFKLALILLFLGIVTSAFIGRLIEGELTAMEGIMLIALPLGSLLLAMVNWNNFFTVVLSCLLCAGAVAIWALHRISEQRIRRYLDEQEIERYKATISRDPKNAAAHSMLGDVYLRLKRYDEAIKEFEEVLRLDPTSQSDKYKLRLAAEKKREAELNGVACPRCHAINPRLSAQCLKCSYELNRPIAVDFVAWIIQPQSLKRIALVGLVALVPLTIVFFFMSLLPPILRFVFWLCLLAAFLVWVRRSIL